MQDTDITGNKKAHRIHNPVIKRLYSIKEAAVYLGRPVWGIRSLIWDGKIRYIQDGRKSMTATSFIPQQVKAAGMTMTEVMEQVIEDVLFTTETTGHV